MVVKHNQGEIISSMTAAEIKGTEEAQQVKEREHEAYNSIPKLKGEHDKLYQQAFELYGGYVKSEGFPAASAHQ